MTTAPSRTSGPDLALRLMAEGKTVRAISDETALMPREVADLARSNGYVIGADGVAWKGKQVGSPRLSPAPPHGATVPPRPLQPPEPRPAVRDLIFTAKASTKPRIRALADRVSMMLDQLQALVTAEAEAVRDRERQAQEKAQAAADVQRLREQLKAAEAKLRPAAKADYDSAEVRRWAAANKVECPKVGRVPAVVVAAWRAREATP
jgi:hypothetical protein